MRGCCISPHELRRRPCPAGASRSQPVHPAASRCIPQPLSTISNSNAGDKRDAAARSLAGGCTRRPSWGEGARGGGSKECAERPRAASVTATCTGDTASEHREGKPFREANKHSSCCRYIDRRMMPLALSDRWSGYSGTGLTQRTHVRWQLEEVDAVVCYLLGVESPQAARVETRNEGRCRPTEARHPGSP